MSALPEIDSTPVSFREGLSTDDVLNLCLPLLRQVAQLHAKGLVAPLDEPDALRVTNGVIWLANARAHAPKHASAVATLSSGALSVAGGTLVYLPSLATWEHGLGHHDAVTDVLALGVLLAAVSTGLDPKVAIADLERARDDVRSVNGAIHPVLSTVISRMTELNRDKREQDLASVVTLFERYRDQDVGRLADLRKLAASAKSDKRSLVLEHLQKRLYDRSRRNRLLYFKPTAATLNLTVGSVPLMLNVESIQADALLTWRPGDFVTQVLENKPVALSRWLRFEDYPFITASLDRLRLDASRDAIEYGFSQLRLVVCFLHWTDLKNAPDERITSPLLMLPVRIAKKKGVRDAFTIEAANDIAEVNPVLRHHLAELYGLVLPESVDLNDFAAIDALHQSLSDQIRATEPAVTLEKVDKPRVQLIHAVAQRKLDAFRRRARISGRNAREKHGFSYSYSDERRAPLGIQMFANLVSPSAAPNSDLLDAPKPRIFNLGPDVRQIERDQYQLGNDDAANPYRWAFDLCSVSLANFNYRKMALVADYGSLIEKASSPAFSTLFPEEARPLLPVVSTLELTDRYNVVDADPTQNQAIAVARSGASFIIQGPPGTGKSQTIANLIADYLARGQRVLFVCEKRAALDVVQHRLERRGLGRLCCVMHDAQNDKKPFIQALKETYEAWSASAPGVDALDAKRGSTVASIAKREQQLEGFASMMSAKATGADQSLVELMRRCIALGPAPSIHEILPEHRIFEQHRDTLERISADLQRLGAAPVLARHPARFLKGKLFDEQISALREKLANVRTIIDAVPERDAPFSVVTARASVAARIMPLLNAGLIELLDAGSALFKKLRVSIGELEDRMRAAQAASEQAQGWRNPLALDETNDALALANKLEATWLRFFMPSFWRLRRIINERFDSSGLAVKPALSAIVQRLLDRYTTSAAVEEHKRLLARETGVDDVVPLFDVARAVTAGSQAERDLREAVLQGLPKQHVERLSTLDTQRGALDETLVDWLPATADAVGKALGTIQVEIIPSFANILRAVETLPETLRAAVRLHDVTLDELESAIANSAVASSPGARDADVDAASLESAKRELSGKHDELCALNATLIVEKTHERFAGSLTRDKAYTTGRKELEHEIGKVMRYRAIRDMMGSAAGHVIRDLKPVWLMSPLSVADALPLSAEFDVVIVDEASQVPLEHAIPALERGKQMIIVGDDKQLPPTSFFATRADERDDDEDVPAEGVPQLSAESLLDHATTALPSSMLGWHYRSRDEALISFCNQQFYEGRLLTAPAVNTLPKREPIARDGAQALLERPVSYHRLQGVYAQRRNTVEADYIAQLVSGILARKTGQSVGIVAFSEAQQTEIEQALERLAKADDAFRDVYEAEVERREDGQFVGLFVKNLENVQGDERDIVILSVCYGPDANDRMAMTFGPINQRGGDRRLNVIFSRAKRHMAIVTSFDPERISNDYNDGAGCLKAYLTYARALSIGDSAAANAVLRSTALAHGGRTLTVAQDAVVEDIANALRARGHEVDTNVGASLFRCDLAVKRGSRYALGVLVDTATHYANPDIDDRYRLKPALLDAFGWTTRWVLTRDWLNNREGVLARLHAALA